MLIIPALLFGLAFAGGGYFFLAESALPMWQNWQRMQDWRPTNARLLSIYSADNETRADYHYDYAGSSYQGHKVGVSEFNDNIGSYQQDMQAYLRKIQRNGDLLPIWVNPANPAEAVIDRDMRWGLFAFSSGFCSVFIFIGLGVIYSSLRSKGKTATRIRPSFWGMRKAWQQAQNDGATDLAFLEYCQQRYANSAADDSAVDESDDVMPADWKSRKGWEGPQIKSDAIKGSLFMWVFTLVWNAISTPVLFMLPDELQQENYAALAALLFPVIGLSLLYKAIKLTLEYRRFGSVVYSMDPYPGGIGGHVGGHVNVKNLDYRRAREAQSLLVRLECVYSFVSGSGKNRSRQESIKWAEQGSPKIDNARQGVNLVFRFDVPGQLPQADIEQSGAYHFWRLGVTAEIPGIDLERSYNIPVFATSATSRHSHHDISAQAVAARTHASDASKLAISSGHFDIEGLSRALKIRNEGNRILLAFPMFRNKMLTLFAAIFAGGFGFASYSMADMASAGGLFGIFITLFGIPFFLVALLATIAVVYLPFNNLRVAIESGEVSVLRRLLFIPIYHRKLRRADISHLSIKRSGSTGQGVDKIEHFKIRAQDNKGGNVTLAEDIDGKDVATHLRDYLSQRIGVAVKEG
jgi:hypothetical protein